MRVLEQYLQEEADFEARICVILCESFCFCFCFFLERPTQELANLALAFSCFQSVWQAGEEWSREAFRGLDSHSQGHTVTVKEADREEKTALRRLQTSLPSIL